MFLWPSKAAQSLASASQRGILRNVVKTAGTESRQWQVLFIKRLLRQLTFYLVVGAIEASLECLAEVTLTQSDGDELLDVLCVIFSFLQKSFRVHHKERMGQQPGRNQQGPRQRFDDLHFFV